MVGTRSGDGMGDWVFELLESGREWFTLRCELCRKCMGMERCAGGGVIGVRSANVYTCAGWCLDVKVSGGILA